MSLVGADGGMDLYDGALRAIDAEGKPIFDGVHPADYRDYLIEEVRSWSYMKFPAYPLARPRGRLVPGRTAGPAELLRLHRHADRGGGPQGVHGARAWRPGACDPRLPLGAPDLHDPLRRNDQGPAVRRRPSGHRPGRERRAAARKVLRSSRRRAARCFTTTRSTTTARSRRRT